MNRRNARDFVLKCGSTCYEGTRETDFESEVILKDEDLVALHQQVSKECVLR